MFKNFIEFAWALKNYYIQQSFKGKRIKFERKMISCGYYTDKCLFRIYAAFQNWASVFRFGPCTTYSPVKALITIMR